MQSEVQEQDLGILESLGLLLEARVGEALLEAHAWHLDLKVLDGTLVALSLGLGFYLRPVVVLWSPFQGYLGCYGSTHIWATTVGP